MFHDLILQQVSHRPWPLPAGPWLMQQSWHDLLFAHWPVPAASLRPLIPPGLEIDTYDGTAWLSIVPFRMTGVRPRYVPGMPWLSAFAELNVRTYVRLPIMSATTSGAPALAAADDSRPGVFFFSLDATNPIAVEMARAFYHLPYFNARMRVHESNGQIHYDSRRTDRRSPPAEFQAVYGPTGGIQPAFPGTLEQWLAERYALYAVDKRGRLYRGGIHHPPWPLQAAMVEIQTNTLAAAMGIDLPPVAPLVQFSRRLDVLIWPLQRVTEGASVSAAVYPSAINGAATPAGAEPDGHTRT
jgi:uncharacterized protein